MLMMSVHGAKADVLGASSERAIDPQNTFEHRDGDLDVHSGCIDFVSQNSAVHHHRDHDDAVRSHAQIGAPLRERKEARRLAIVRDIEQAAAYPVGDKIAALAIGLDTIKIAGWCRITKSRHFFVARSTAFMCPGTLVEKSRAILPHDAT